MSRSHLFGLALLTRSVELAAAQPEYDHDNPDMVLHRTQSLFHPYSPNGFDVPHWTFSGDTSLSDKYIRLTPDRQSRRGQLWSTVPWMGTQADADKDVATFEAHVRFNVHGQGTTLFGDGFALWLTSDILDTGPVFGGADNFVGMAIIFDTYSNLNQGHQQYISVILGDGQQQYDHDKDGGDVKLAGCEYDFRGDVMDARIVYDGSLLRMYLARVDEGWEECFIVRRVKIPKGYHFGLTAATGDLADNHDIVFFKVYDPAPMSEDEYADISARIEMDIDAGVESEVHVDPQYDVNNRKRTPENELPLWVTGAMICCVLVVALAVYFFAAQEKPKEKFAAL